MRPLDKRVLAMLAVLLAAQLAAWAARPADGPPAALAADRIPLRAGDWHGRDLGALDAMTLDMLAPDAYLNREYASADGSLAHLAVIFGHLKETFHSPGFCLLGGGWNIVAKSRLAVETGRGAPIVVNRFLLAREGYQAVVLYYYVAGARSTPSWVKHQAYLAWDRLRGRPPVGALVRLTVPAVPDAAAATERGADLLGRLHPQVAAVMKP